MKQLLLIFAFTVCVWSVSAQITMQKQDDGILINEEGKRVLFYQMIPKSLKGEYARNHYIHPLWSPQGQILTEDFPDDHLHHRGIFWAWHQVWINGERIGDPWEIKGFEQQVTEVEFISSPNGPGILNTTVEWMSDKWKKNGKEIPYLEENTTIKIFPEQDNFRRIDFEIDLQALAENLQLGGSEDEKGYGGFSVRMVLPDDIWFSGPEGLVTPEVTSVESEGFINITGSVEKKNQDGGIVIVDHLNNPDYPQRWILRKEKSMQNAAWPGNKLVEIPQEKSIVLRYSLIVYSGEMKMNKLKKLVKRINSSY